MQVKTPYMFSGPSACFKFRKSLNESKLSTAFSEFKAVAHRATRKTYTAINRKNIGVAFQ